MANRERKNELKIYLSDKEQYILDQKVKISGMKETHGMDAGRYTTDILSVIEGFAPDIDLFTEQDVERLLFESAPIRARRDVPGAAV